MINKKIPTPFLLINYNELKNNIEKMAAAFQGTKINLKPHFKTHKSIEIAKIQIETGATGITCATLNEAEVLCAAGISDIFLAYPIFDSASLNRFESLTKKIRISCAVDSLKHLEIFKSCNFEVHVRIEIDSGHHRCGVLPETSELDPLIEFLKENSQVKLDGVFTHAGHSYSAKNSEDLKKIALEESEAVIKAAEIVVSSGLSCDVISVGSTPTAFLASKSGKINECRPGNYVFYDSMQLSLNVCQQENCSLYVCSSIIGIYKNRIVINAGSKSLGLDKGAHGLQTISGHGLIVGKEDLQISRLSEEHGIIDLKENQGHDLKIGDRIFIIPNHSCAAANYFEQYYVDHLNGDLQNWLLVGKR